MRRLLIYINIVMGILFGSCNSSPIPSPQTSPVIGEIISRDAIASTSIADGSKAIFHATGGANIDNQIFTFSNGTWQNNNGEDIHINSSIETKLTALYPAYSGETLITHNPYDNDTLLDVMIAESSFIDQTNIQLNFRHLFSRLTLHIHSSIAEDIEAVKIAVPQIESINPVSGELKFLEQLHTTQFTGAETGVYSCIVPSHPNCPVELTFIFKSGKEVTHSLTHTFVSGHKYECHVNRPGIRNAEDLIEFYTLISCPYNYKGNKTLKDFGEEFGDRTIYRLLEDITLTEKQCNNLNSIGNNQYPFDDIFDGEGHKISKLKIKAFDGHAGFFGYISEKGCVRNLRLDSCYSQTITKSSGSGAGILSGICQGTINNCRITNSSISNEDDSPTGAIAGLASGEIINCSVENTTIIATTLALGSITGNLDKGKIFNCYASHNTIENKTGNTNARGGIAGNSINGEIQNCYVYNNSYDSRSKNKGQFIGIASNTTLKHCYYDISKSTFPLIKEATNCTATPNYKYNTSFKTTINDSTLHISESLNQWIGKQKIYRRWTSDNGGPPYFE